MIDTTGHSTIDTTDTIDVIHTVRATARPMTQPGFPILGSGRVAAGTIASSGRVWRAPRRRGRVWRRAGIGPIGTHRPLLCGLPG